MTVDLENLAKRLGAAEREIVMTVETEAGVVAHFFDGTSYIDVPKTKPDADGKTGLMYLRAPTAEPTAFPVFAGNVPDAPHPTAAAEPEAAAEGEPEGEPDAGEQSETPASSEVPAESPVPVKGASAGGQTGKGS